MYEKEVKDDLKAGWFCTLDTGVMVVVAVRAAERLPYPQPCLEEVP